MSKKCCVTLDWKDRVCLLTFDNPEKRNALDEDMIDDFSQAIRKVKSESRTRVLVMTGAGSTFSAGANLHMLLDRAKTDVVTNWKNVFAIYAAIFSMTDLEIPTIAAINGPALGVGASLSLLCDMRFAASQIPIGFTYVKLGFHPGLGTEYFLTRLIGPARTFELLMTGDPITAEEACRIGLVNQVLPADQLLDHVLTFAGKIAAQPVLPIRMLKQTIPAAMRSGLDDFLQMQAACQSITFAGPDGMEGVTAMLGKRRPRFQDEY